MSMKAIAARIGWFTLLLMASLSTAHAQAGSVLIWPVDPVIRQDQRAVGLWLENKGQTPVQLQVRVFAWNQPDGESRHTPQTDVTGTPPMLRIEAGKRQFVRLTRTTEAVPGQETAYRVIVDEIPPPPSQDAAASGVQGAGIRFQMRYSIPLFVYGKGMEALTDDRGARNAKAAQPALSWRTVTQDGTRYLEVRNTGATHARLVDASFRQGAVTRPLEAGLLGYVLPGAAARFAIPAGVEPQGTLIASVNTAVPMEIPHAAP